MAKPPTKIPTEVKDIAQAIANNLYKNAKMEWRDDGSVKFTATSPDGTAIITLEKKEFSGVKKESRILVFKPANKNERLERVLQLRRDENLTQSEISHYTMTSQKTVSNDIKELKEQGLLDN